MSASYWLQRCTNGVRKVAAGLTPFGESAWPGVKNDLFVAHESIYCFLATLVPGKRVLDAGCGTGYGSEYLARAGAVSVIGIDRDSRSIAFARRRYQHPALSFEEKDCERLDFQAGSLDLVASSNMLEHLARPQAFLSAVRSALAPGGALVLAVPPITRAEALEENRRIHYHRSNRTVDEWISCFEGGGWHWKLVAHRFRGEVAPDFQSPFPSALTPADWVFEPSGRDDVYARVPYTAVFSLS